MADVQRNHAYKVAFSVCNAGDYGTMTDEQTDAWKKEVTKLSAATDKLIQTYYNKIKKATSSTVATRLCQIEVYILTEIRMQVLEGVPFPGDKYAGLHPATRRAG